MCCVYFHWIFVCETYYVRIELLECIVRMDRHYNRANKSKLDYDWQHDTWHLGHTHRDMDQRISDWYMLYRMDIEHQSYILGDNLVVHPYNQVSMHKLDDFERHDIHCINHMAMDDTDCQLVRANKLLD